MISGVLPVTLRLGLPSAVLVHLPYSAFRYERGDEATRAQKARFPGEAGLAGIPVSHRDAAYRRPLRVLDPGMAERARSRPVPRPIRVSALASAVGLS